MGRQFYKSYYSEDDLIGADANALALFHFIKRHINYRTGVLNTTTATLASGIGITYKASRGAISRLERKGLLKTVQGEGGVIITLRNYSAISDSEYAQVMLEDTREDTRKDTREDLGKTSVGQEGEGDQVVIDDFKKPREDLGKTSGKTSGQVSILDNILDTSLDNRFNNYDHGSVKNERAPVSGSVVVVVDGNGSGDKNKTIIEKVGIETHGLFNHVKVTEEQRLIIQSHLGELGSAVELWPKLVQYLDNWVEKNSKERKRIGERAAGYLLTWPLEALRKEVDASRNRLNAPRTNEKGLTYTNPRATSEKRKEASLLVSQLYADDPAYQAEQSEWDAIYAKYAKTNIVS